jgi:hypothetical protein
MTSLTQDSKGNYKARMRLPDEWALTPDTQGGQPADALALCEVALTSHDEVLGRHHDWTKNSARVTADALEALGRIDEAKSLREEYGLTPPTEPWAPIRFKMCSVTRAGHFAVNSRRQSQHKAG